MKPYRADLHVHTVISPCAGVEMIPPLIVDEALQRGIQLIAVTDHNATANIAAVQKAAAGSGLSVLPGVELQTREEVHVLCLFDHLDQAGAFQEWIDARLPAITNRADFFGNQFVVDETGEFLRHEERLLLNSVSATLKDAWQQVAALEGLFIPAHVNRQAFGLIPVLGLLPEDIDFEAFEISAHMRLEEARKKHPQLAGYPLLQNGDVHYLGDFLGSSEFTIEQPTIAELRRAIHCEEGRLLRNL